VDKKRGNLPDTKNEAASIAPITMMAICQPPLNEPEEGNMATLTIFVRSSLSLFINSIPFPFSILKTGIFIGFDDDEVVVPLA